MKPFFGLVLDQNGSGAQTYLFLMFKIAGEHLL